jgi:sugar phosphate isomerase/epimerase
MADDAAAPLIKGIGFSTIAGTGNLDDLDRALERIAGVGASHAELTLCTEDLIVDGRVLEPRARRLEEICARYSLGYSVHGPICMNLMDEPRLALHKAAQRAMIELSARVGADVLVHHTGRVPMAIRPEIDRLLALEREGLAELADLARPHGIKLAVENLFPEAPTDFTLDPIRLAEHLAAVDHPAICGTMDFSHAWIMATSSGVPYIESLKAFAPWVNHLHLHDSFGRPQEMKTYSVAERMAYGQGDLHLPLGWGGIPWDEIVPQLSIRPGTVMIVELPPRWHSEMAACLEECRRLAGMFGCARPIAAQ